MLKEEDPENSKAYAILAYDGSLRGIELKAKLQDTALEVATHQDNLQVAVINLDDMMNFQMAQTESSPDKKSTHSLKNAEHNPSVRFLCLIKEREELLQLHPELLDRNWKNVLQDCNLQFTLIFRDHL